VRAVLLLTLLAACASERARGDAASGGVHEPGILDPSSPDFHGALLVERDWDFPLCQTCHGDDFAGGASGVSCLECHEDGPTACDTCHEAEPVTGPHPAHFAGEVPCAECHRVPARWDDEGHIRVDGAADPPPAEVALGPLSARDLDPPEREGPPSYAAGTQTCSNVYCHGGALGEAGALHPAPSWTTEGDQAACGGCHGVPPPDHVEADGCAACHAGGAAHLDGTLDLGDGSGDCTACHGGGGSAAPPRDLSGATTTAAIGVGAHRPHLEAWSGIAAPIECSECHLVPSAIDSPGHIGSAPPAELTIPGWNRTTETCSVWCHGDAAPVWTRVGEDEATCGSCHGIPPVDGVHDPELDVFDCATCHPSYPTQHVDGDVDVL